VDGQTAPAQLSVEETRAKVIGKKPILPFWKLMILGLAVVCMLVAVLSGYRLRSHVKVRYGSQIQSIAVLPLVSLSSDPTQEYFSDGLTDELITELAKTEQLRVISRTSVVAFRGLQKQAPEIGQELHVDGIVEGTVERVGNRVRIRAQLIRAENDQHLWAEVYDRDVSDVLALERDVARDIAQQIGVRLSPNGPNRPKIAAAAHEDYLMGRYYWNKRTEPGLRKGIEYFRKAIDQQPNYAPAYAGLADSYVMLANWGFAEPADSYLKAKAAEGPGA
jgi:adenylate cyclase